MISITVSFLRLAGSLVLVASQQSPVAVVEEVSGSPAGIQFMDYVEPGQVIKLGPQDSIIIGYFRSCWRETIAAGTVTIGAEESTVQGGKVERAKVACQPSKAQLSGELLNSSGGNVFREGPHGGPPARSDHPQFTLYGLSPIIEVRPGDTLIIERIDGPRERHEIVLSDNQLVQGAFLDLARAGVVLAAGGLYRARAGKQEAIFKIDPAARSGNTPIIGRLLRLPVTRLQ